MTVYGLVVRYLDNAQAVTALVLPNGTCYRKGDVPRPRWHRSTEPVAVGPFSHMFGIGSNGLLGSAFMELTDEEARQMTERPGTVGREANARFERVRRALIGDHRAASWPDSATMTNWELALEEDVVPIHPAGTLQRTAPSPDVEEATGPLSVADSHVMRTDYPRVSNGTVPLVEGGTYLTRKIGRRADVTVFREYRETGAHVLTYGQSGTGKTMMTQAAYGSVMKTVLCTEDTVAADFIGEHVNIPGRGWTWVDGPLPICMERGLLLYVDEIARARQKQLAVLFSAMDGRREISITAGSGEPRVVRARPGFAVAASANLNAATIDIDEALKSRFHLKLEITTDYRMAREQLGIDPGLVTAAENLEQRRHSREIGWSPQMRDLVLAQENADRIGMPSALGSMVNSAPIKDRDVVADVLSKATGRKVDRLVLT